MAGVRNVASKGRKWEIVVVMVVIMVGLANVLTSFDRSLMSMSPIDYAQILSSVVQSNQGLVVYNNSSDFEAASLESFGFFDDIPQKDWDLMKDRIRGMQPNKCSWCRGGTRPGAFFQNHFEPEIACRHEKRIGRQGDGGKWVCDPHRLKKKPDCLVYSVGSNNDFSFEKAIASEIGTHCEIHTFDPANYTAGSLQVGPQEHYHIWGIDGTQRRDRRGRQFLTLRQTVERLGHVGRSIDIFKIDCEGCELSSFNTWINETEVGVSLKQILVEVHAKDKDTVVEPATSNFFKGMHDNGYVIFHKEPNIHWWGLPCVEFALVKLGIVL